MAMTMKSALTALLALLSIPAAIVSAEKTADAFDAPYVTNPPPGPGQTSFEWWWFQITGEKVGDVVPGIEVNFHRGFLFTRPPGHPDYRIQVHGIFPNGTQFGFEQPVQAFPTFESGGATLRGEWTLGSFEISKGFETVKIILDNEAGGFVGTIELENKSVGPHTACTLSTSEEPYFSKLVGADHKLNEYEQTLYNEIGWAVSMPRSAAKVDVKIKGSPLQLTNALAYHDHNWGPRGMDKFVWTWFVGIGHCGPYDLTFLEVQAIDSPRSRDIVRGFLAKDGKFIQNQCTRYDLQTEKDSVSFTLGGQATSPADQREVMTEISVAYVDKEGKKYKFDLELPVDQISPDRPIYRRWKASGKGGAVGEEQHECRVVIDWLNPSVQAYDKTKNIFEGQALKKKAEHEEL